MEEYKSEAHVLIENSNEKDEENKNESKETTEAETLMTKAIDNSQEKEPEKDQSTQNEDNENSTTNSRKSSINSLQENANALKTPMTISMDGSLDDETEIEFKRTLLSVDFEDQCEKVENAEKFMKSSAETKITINGQSDQFRKRSETYTVSAVKKPKIDKLSKLNTNLVRIGCVLFIIGVITGVGFTIAHMFGWEFSDVSDFAEGGTGANLKSVEMKIHPHLGCGSAKGVITKLHHKSGYCEVSPYGSFGRSKTIKWTESKLGNCAHFRFDPNISTMNLYIQTKENDQFCPISVKIILNDNGKDTTYSLSLPNGYYHNINLRDQERYNATLVLE